LASSLSKNVGELQKIKPEYKDITISYQDWTSAESNRAVWDQD
jgi:hypothetical protein